MYSVTPEMVLGKRARSQAGVRLGEIVDVGIHDHRRVKFLLVEDPDREDFVRLAVDLIESIDDGDVVLRQENLTEPT